MKRALLGVGLIAAALLAYFLFRGDEEVSAEAKYDGVHLCSPSQQEAATVAAGDEGAQPTPSGNLDLEPSRTQGPLFAQNATTWGGEEYDKARSQDVGCGQTIAQCGCAMSSVATVLALFQLVTTPSGEALNPGSLNSWFNQGAQLTGGGWVSHGYAYGNVVWTAVNNYSAGVPQSATTKSIRYAGWGNGSEAEIKAQLAQGLPVVLEVPGHFIAAVGLQGDEILINDPFYAERTTLRSYTGLVKSSRLFEPSEDLSGVLITVPSNLRVKVTDAQGREVGTLGGDTPQDAQRDAENEIPGATYRFEEAWRDPTCTERPPQDGQGVNTIFIPDPSGSYNVEVINPDGDDTEAVVHIYDERGGLRMLTQAGDQSLDFTFQASAGGGGTGPGPTATPTAAPTETPTPTPTPTPEIVIEEPEEETEEPTAIPVTPSATATATLTPQPGAAMWISPPTATALTTAIPPSPGCRIGVSWSSGGDPQGTVQLLRNSQPIFNSGPGPVTFFDPFQPGPKTYVVRATNSSGVVSEAQVTVTPTCLRSYKVDLFDECDDGCYVPRHTWVIEGSQIGTVRIIHAPFNKQVGTAPLGAGVFIQPDEEPCPNDYQLMITVGGETLTTPVVRATGPAGEGCGGSGPG